MIRLLACLLLLASVAHAGPVMPPMGSATEGFSSKMILAGDTYTFPEGPKVIIGTCDVKELRAASQAWADRSFPGTPDPYAWPTSSGIASFAIYNACDHAADTPNCLRGRAAAIERQQQAQAEARAIEQRWRKAVEACR